jgi:hypothetical protein
MRALDTPVTALMADDTWNCYKNAGYVCWFWVHVTLTRAMILDKPSNPFTRSNQGKTWGVNECFKVEEHQDLLNFICAFSKPKACNCATRYKQLHHRFPPLLHKPCLELAQGRQEEQEDQVGRGWSGGGGNVSHSSTAHLWRRSNWRTCAATYRCPPYV